MCVCVCVRARECSCTYVFTNLLVQERYNTRSVFFAEFNRLEFSFHCLRPVVNTKFKEPILPYNLFIAGGRIIGCIPFSKI